jgi:hypothetical protein
MSRPEAVLELRALLGLVVELARDVGHLRRRLEPDTSVTHLAERVALRIEYLDALLHPAAAELFCDMLAVCGDESVAVDEALRIVDDRARRIRTLLLRDREDGR